MKQKVPGLQMATVPCGTSVCLTVSHFPSF